MRDWLDEENVSHNLPKKGKVLLLYHEFRRNIARHLGRKCFKGKQFILKLPVLFTLLFAGHSLDGRNHDALVDAQQTVLLLSLFMDLCKPPGQRVIFQGTLPIWLPGMTSFVTNSSPQMTLPMHPPRTTTITMFFPQGTKRHTETEEHTRKNKRDRSG